VTLRAALKKSAGKTAKVAPLRTRKKRRR
jgi:hypothetical protein